MADKILRSPFFYVGDKYKLVPQLKKLIPENISMYVEPFAGGGSSFLNVKAKNYLINDLDINVIALHKLLSAYSDNQDELFQQLFNVIDTYELSCSFINKTVPDEFKKKYSKTYYAHFNKESYSRLRSHFNISHDLFELYILLIYGFNHMIRFNNQGYFNLSVGNLDFNKNVYQALCNYLNFMKLNKVSFFNLDFEIFLNQLTFEKDSYVYCDPPYLISGSEYNKYWKATDDYRLYDCLDELNSRNIRFGITNLAGHKGNVNNIFLKWSNKYYSYRIHSNYISFNDNTIKNDSAELFVTNYNKS